MREDISIYIDEHFDEMVDRLKELISIPSKESESADGMPFGRYVGEALTYARSLMDEYGFITTNYDNYAVTADIDEKRYGLDILAHLDVVSEGEGWTVCRPFEPIVKDGRIYGRGAADDKGPAIAALFAMRAVKDLQIPLKKGVRLILGTDEESGGADLDYYYAREKEAEMSFTPDAEFPVVNTEKGRLSSKINKKVSLDRTGTSVISFNSGLVTNVVPSKASALISNIKKQDIADRLSEAVSDKDISVNVVEEGSDCRINVEGIGGHAAFPELSKNALTAMLSIIAKLPLDDNEGNRLIKGIAGLFPYSDYYGRSLGISMSDEVSGKLTISLNLLKFENGDFEAVFDCRAALCANDDNLTAVIASRLDALGVSMQNKTMVKPHHVPADSFFVKTLLDVYEDYFGEKGEAHSTGGGTYVHDLKNGVAFGCEIQGVDNHMHGPDEFMELEILKKSAKIFAEAIIRLCA